MSKSESILVLSLTSLLLMYLINQRGHYSRLTRTLMDILLTIALGAGLMVILRLLFVD